MTTHLIEEPNGTGEVTRQSVETREELESFRRIFIGGAEEASEVMTRWTARKIHLRIDRVQRLLPEQVADELKLKDEILTMIVLGFEGEVGATFLLMFDERQGRCLAARLARTALVLDQPWSDLEKSALMETGNILACAYLNVMTDTLGAEVRLTEPFFVQDYGASVIEQAVLEQAAEADHVLLCETSFECANEPVSWRFLLIPDRRFERALLEES